VSSANWSFASCVSIPHGPHPANSIFVFTVPGSHVSTDTARYAAARRSVRSLGPAASAATRAWSSNENARIIVLEWE
jgi:hypothetical protein